MTLRQAAGLALVALALGACKKKEPPAAGPGAGPTTAGADTAAANARARARADSIAAAERARVADAERERARAAEVARAREALTEIVYFEYDSDEITAEAQARLQRKISILQANPGVEVRVEGHTDERGSEEYNVALGQRRAEAVRNFLANYGITGERVTTISYGELRPATEGSGEESWSRNRRAEFAIVGGNITTVPAEVR